MSSAVSIPVLVWGGGTGGVAAALQAARSGAATLLLTPGPWLGGMLSAAGVCCPDGNELTPWQTGLWGALLRGLAQAEPTGLDHNWVSCFGFQPATAEALLRRWVAAESRLQWLPGCSLRGVEHSGDRISQVAVERCGTSLLLAPELCIDGSDLGELLALGAGPFRLGWESRDCWDEPSAPAAERLATDPFFARQPVQSPTWVVMGQLSPRDPAELTNTNTNPAQATAAVPPLAPPFETAAAAFGLERTLTYGRLPGDRVMLNWPLQGNDWHHDLAGLFAGDLRQQCDHLQQLQPRMQEHSLAFAAALQEASDGALQLAPTFPMPAQDGDVLLGSSPLALMPYWREGRRLLGAITVREQDLLPLGEGACRAVLPGDGRSCSSIAVGNYANDHHYPGGDWPLAAKSCRWGGRWSGTPFCIPYGALVSAGCSNLLAADKCISVSHMANGATRLQPLVLNIGQAAGLAAALCVKRRCRPADLPVKAVQQALIEDAWAPAAPFPLWDTPWHHPRWRERQLACLHSPERLDHTGHLQGETTADLDDPLRAPAEPHEQLWSGSLHGDAASGYRLDIGVSSWPLITLEPALNRHLARVNQGQRLRLIGCANPWGPWLRVSRLAA